MLTMMAILIFIKQTSGQKALPDIKDSHLLPNDKMSNYSKDIMI